MIQVEHAETILCLGTCIVWLISDELSDVIAQEDGPLAIGDTHESTVLRDREIPP